jgi:hypothetical protein
MKIPALDRQLAQQRRQVHQVLGDQVADPALPLVTTKAAIAATSLVLSRRLILAHY